MKLSAKEVKTFKTICAHIELARLQAECANQDAKGGTPKEKTEDDETFFIFYC